MKKQVYDVVREEEYIAILKNDERIYEIPIAEKCIDLKQLYEKMAVDIQDEIFVKKKFEKIEEPSNDGDRIFNNTIDFMHKLLCSLNEKLKVLRDEQENSVFK